MAGSAMHQSLKDVEWPPENMVKEALDLRQRYDSIVKNTMGGM
jgi:hypothetical protein